MAPSDTPALDRDDAPATQENPGALDRAANALVGRLLDLGIDGIGPVDSVQEVVARARKKSRNDEQAIDRIVNEHIRMAGVGGFVTGFGGVTTMAVSLPANVVEFYTLATRMCASIASIRGYDLDRPSTRSAVMLSLVGADADDLIRKAGLSSVANLSGSGRLAQMAVSRMPATVGMMINKAVGFRLLTNVGGKALSRFVRYVPVAGGLVGAGLDGLLMKRLADHARGEFVEVERAAAGELAEG